MKDAALKYFTIHGYEGASLSLIAEDAGIRKQSIYAHFKGKDDLFLQVLHDAKETELRAVEQYFCESNTENPATQLYGFLVFIIELFEQNEQLKFWLRMTFFPPAHLASLVAVDVADMEIKIYEIILAKFRHWIEIKQLNEQDAEIAARAFLGITDALMIELAYGKEEKILHHKLEAFWNIYWRGVSR
ncbi:TetR/AcrR family transcriptional regulator [Paenibacillus yanchengensis]|uniref:TetR/AcrR family transcriptional regulator n=1 Tax=Paenibacillus yanchengensis TaxID=2035833 RepID=A0ABW4YQA4_9BACL